MAFALLELKPGDFLVIYSDGLTEAENGAQVEFGEERLLALIRATAPQGAQATESSLWTALDKFTRCERDGRHNVHADRALWLACRAVRAPVGHRAVDIGQARSRHE